MCCVGNILRSHHSSFARAVMANFECNTSDYDVISAIITVSAHWICRSLLDRFLAWLCFDANRSIRLVLIRMLRTALLCVTQHLLWPVICQDQSFFQEKADGVVGSYGKWWYSYVIGKIQSVLIKGDLFMLRSLPNRRKTFSFGEKSRERRSLTVLI